MPPTSKDIAGHLTGQLVAMKADRDRFKAELINRETQIIILKKSNAELTEELNGDSHAAEELAKHCTKLNADLTRAESDVNRFKRVIASLELVNADLRRQIEGSPVSTVTIGPDGKHE